MYRELIKPDKDIEEFVNIRDGASPEEIAEAERAIGMRFPEALVDLLRELNGDGWFLYSTDKMIDSNLFIHEDDSLEENPDMKYLLAFAGNGAGENFCFSMKPGEEGIYIGSMRPMSTTKSQIPSRS